MPDAATGGVLHVSKHFRRMGQFVSGVKRQDVRGGALSVGSQAVRSRVFRAKLRMPLQDDVCLLDFSCSECGTQSVCLWRPIHQEQAQQSARQVIRDRLLSESAPRRSKADKCKTEKSQSWLGD